MFEGAEYTSSFCHAKDQAREGERNKGMAERMDTRGLTANFGDLTLTGVLHRWPVFSNNMMEKRMKRISANLNLQ